MFSSLRTLGAALILLFPALTAASTSATWTGKLYDAANRPVPAATLTLTSASGGPSYSATTTHSGEFAFPSLTPATYQISVVTPSAHFQSAASIAITEGARLTTNLALSSPEKGLVSIQDQNSTTPQASGGERLSASKVSSLPLNSRDFSKLLLLAAGTMTDANGAANFTQQFAVNGQRGSTTVFAMDGVDTTDPEMGGATFSNFNVDAIQEVESSSGVMPAEIGHGAAGYTNVVTRTGTNELHGSVFEFFRNASLDARNYFDKVGLDRRRIPPFIRNEFGGTIGGPVVLPHLYDGRDRTYFVGEYQGFRQILGTTQVFPVPTADERSGIVTVCFPNGNNPCVNDTLTVPVAIRDPASA